MNSERVHLETPRLILRLPQTKDIPEIIRYFRENEAHLAPFDPKRPDGFLSEAYWQTRIPKHHAEFQADQALRLYLFDKPANAEVIGTLAFSQIFRGSFQACYLGYGIAERYQGHGLMFEGASAAIDYAFRELNIHRIMANHLLDNPRSAKLLQRLGFVREGLAKDYLRIDGEWRDHVLNSLTNPQWEEK
jgi:ribosomal-protein-alanine N-acetyltransferase